MSFLTPKMPPLPPVQPLPEPPSTEVSAEDKRKNCSRTSSGRKKKKR